MIRRFIKLKNSSVSIRYLGICICVKTKLISCMRPHQLTCTDRPFVQSCTFVKKHVKVAGVCYTSAFSFDDYQFALTPHSPRTNIYMLSMNDTAYSSNRLTLRRLEVIPDSMDKLYIGRPTLYNSNNYWTCLHSSACLLKIGRQRTPARH